MTYEAVLLFGVVFVVGYGVLALARWSYPLSTGQRWTLQGALFVTIGAYFVGCWSKSGQTLAMKTWHLRVVTARGDRLSAATAIARYLLAWTLFAPGMLFIALAQAGTTGDLLALALGFAAMMTLIFTDPKRQLLHDRLLGTRIIRERPPSRRA